MNRAILRVGEHPALFGGHFVGHPILPGAKLLDMIIATLREHGALASCDLEVVSAKFLATIAPLSQLELNWTVAPQGACHFECSVQGRKVASGVIRSTAANTAAPAA